MWPIKRPSSWLDAGTGDRTGLTGVGDKLTEAEQWQEGARQGEKVTVIKEMREMRKGGNVNGLTGERPAGGMWTRGKQSEMIGKEIYKRDRWQKQRGDSRKIWSKCLKRSRKENRKDGREMTGKKTGRKGKWSYMKTERSKSRKWMNMCRKKKIKGLFFKRHKGGRKRED